MEITRLYVAKRFDKEDVASLRRALQVPILPNSWKNYLEERLART